MSDVDVGMPSSESEPSVEGSGPEPRDLARPRLLQWDASVAAWPLTVGSHAEPRICAWSGHTPAELLVTSRGGPLGYQTHLFAPAKPTGDPDATSEPEPIRPTGRPYAEGGELESLAGLRFVAPIPNDNPSRFDLVALDPRRGLVALINCGAPDEPRFREPEDLDLPPDLGLGAGRITQITPVDWDGDGLVDLLVGFDNLEGYWPDDWLTEAEQTGFNLRGGHPGYDEQGQWRGRMPIGMIYFLRNIGRPGAPRFALDGPIGDEDGLLNTLHRPAALAVSWNGQGAMELLLTDNQGEIRLFRNFGGQLPPVLMEPRSLKLVDGDQTVPAALPPERTTLDSADLDGDRRQEMYFGTVDGQVYMLGPAPGRDRARLPRPLQQVGQTLRLGGQVVVAAGDLDDDGDLDLIVGTASGRLLLVEDVGNAEDHRYVEPLEIEAWGEPFRIDPGPDGMIAGPAEPALGFACPTVYDWSDHERPDLIVGGAGGEVLILRNNGAPDQPRFDEPRTLRYGDGPLITAPRVRPAIADVRDRGDVDLITLNLYGFLCAYPRLEVDVVGKGQVLTDLLGRPIKLDGGFAYSGRCALWAGPWTDPEQVDILVGLPRGNRHVIPPLTGEPLTSLDDLPTVLLLINQGEHRFAARPIFFADGSPLIIGSEGCSPCGVPDGEDSETFDLVVAADDGLVHYFSRDELVW